VGYYNRTWAGSALTGWMVRKSNSSRGKIFRTLPDRSWGPLSLLYNGFRGKATGAWHDHLHHLALRLKKNRDVPLLFLWVFMVFSRVKFAFTFTTREHITVLVRLESMKIYYFCIWKAQDNGRKISVIISLRNLNGRYRVAWLHLAWNGIGLQILANTEIKCGICSRGKFY
jgi:hypothetical protein